MRQWAQNDATNNGITLSSSGALVHFASPLGAGDDAPSLAPYLDVTFTHPAESPVTPPVQPLGVGAPNFSDSSGTIFGLAGGIAPDDQCPSGGPSGCPLSVTSEADVARLGAGYVRIDATLSCWSQVPGDATNGAYWINQRVFRKILSAAQDHLIPVVNLQINYGTDLRTGQKCPDVSNGTGTELPPSWWAANVGDFAKWLSILISNSDIGSTYQMYFELGNEVNLHGNQFTDRATYDVQDYPAFFGYGAQLLRHYLIFKPIYSQFTNFRVLTGGIFHPTPFTGSTSPPIYCTDPAVRDGNGQQLPNVTLAYNAVSTAESATWNIPESYLGVSVHPYGYTTNQQYYWWNYLTIANRPGNPNPFYFVHTYSPCNDLYQMLSTFRACSLILF